MPNNVSYNKIHAIVERLQMAFCNPLLYINLGCFTANDVESFKDNGRNIGKKYFTKVSIFLQKLLRILKYFVRKDSLVICVEVTA